MANVAILGQMTGGGAFSVRSYHLIEGMTMRELRVELLAEFTGPAGSNFESFADGWIKVFHGIGLRATKGIRSAWFEVNGNYYDLQCLYLAAVLFYYIG